MFRTICRIVETDILNQLTTTNKNTVKSSPPHRTTIPLTPVKQSSSSNKEKRFKTSGLVATAVQSSHTRKNNVRKSHHHRTTNFQAQKQQQLSSLVYTESMEESGRSTVKIALRKTKSNSSNNCMKNKLNEQNNKKT